MKDIITLLPDHVANQIAAGEVIQRPASIVKELLENSVDAKATHIQLIIKDSGKTLIQVVDNGIGMSSTDIRLAYERHATSKIKTANDLFSLNSKGFRGEALASIAAVAHVETHSRRSTDEVASFLRIEGSQVLVQEISAAPKGTSIAVKNLFYNIPARRNFLKSNTVEIRHIIDEFHRIVIAHPDIHFTFIQSGSELFDLQITNFRKRIVGVFGGKTDEKLVPINEKTTLALIEGFIVKPEFAKKTRGQQYFFVNQRFIKSHFLHHAVLAAFEGLIPKGAHPGYFIFLQLDPKTIDINIHPTKTEVKFEDEQSLYAILRSAIKHSLGIFQVSPTLDFNRDPKMDVPYDFKNKPVSVPPVEVDANFNPFKENTPSGKKGMQSWTSINSDLNTTKVDWMAPPASDVILNLQVPETPRVFQLFSKFIVCALKSSLLVIDQGRAHQRVLYERFLTSITSKKAASQQLLFPVSLIIDTIQKQVFIESHDIFEALGFQITLKTDDELVISGAPEFCTPEGIDKLIETILNSDLQGKDQTAFSHADFIAKEMARAIAIKPGKSLEISEQQALLDDLFGCKETLISPFNRQIFITLEKEDLEKRMN